MLIFHHNDLDGRCAAAIMAQFATNKGYTPSFVEVDYKDQIDVGIVEPGRAVAIVDFRFTPEVMEYLRKRTSRIIWCDHHQTAKDYPYQDLMGFRDFSDKGLSGCECTWKFCFPDAAVPEGALLIGDYDAWRLALKPACFEFYEGMKLEYSHPLANIWQCVLGFDGRSTAGSVAEVRASGRTAMLYRDFYCAEIVKAFGYETTIDGQKAFAMNLYRFGSPSFGSKMTEYPICIAYIHDGEKFTVSLYSTTVDVGAVCKKFGGGGHKGAAGFVCEQLPWRKSDVASRPEDR